MYREFYQNQNKGLTNFLVGSKFFCLTGLAWFNDIFSINSNLTDLLLVAGLTGCTDRFCLVFEALSRDGILNNYLWHDIV